MAPTSSEGTDVSVQVALRIRPLNDSEIVQRAPSMRNLPAEVLSLSPNLPRVTVVPYQRHFTYDHIFGPSTSQQEVFDQCVARLMDKFLDGYNATILAYGQTSSGKTFTMGTGLGEGYADSENTRGIVPRAAAALFDHLQRMPRNEFRYQVQVSFLEIYNEDLIDLLSITSRDGPRNTVTIREDTRGNIIWTGVRELRVNSMLELLSCLENGSALRQTGSTDMNEASSRSHAIFSVSLKQEKWVPNEPEGGAANANGHANGRSTPNGTRLPMRTGTPTGRRSALGGRATPSGLPRPGSMYSRGSPSSAIAEPNPNGPESGNGQWVVMQSKFHFVDLAGSERLKRTNAVGDRAREGISINAGLSALGNVISALGDTTKKSVHVPYRDSKLTRLLQDSLGGNSQTLMIACASPAASNLTETINTLKYANRARNIKNQVTQNQEMSLDVDYLQAQIAKLKAEIRHLKSMSMASDDTDYMQQAVNHETNFLRKRNESLEQELEKVNTSYAQLEAHFETVSLELTQLQEQQEVWRQQQTAALHRSTTGSSVDSSSEQRGATRGSNLANIRSLTESGSSNFQREVEPVIEEYEKVVSALEEQLNQAREAIAAAEAQVQITSAKLRFEETVRESNSIVIAKLKSRVNELHERESGSIAYIHELEAKVHGGIIEEISEDASALRRELAKERTEVSRLRQELETHKDPDVLALVETVTELEEKIQSLQKDAESRQNRRRRIPQVNGIARPQTEIFLPGEEPILSLNGQNGEHANDAKNGSEAVTGDDTAVGAANQRHRRGSSFTDLSPERLALDAISNNPQATLEKLTVLEEELAQLQQRNQSLMKEHEERVKDLMNQEMVETESRRREREATESEMAQLRGRLAAAEAELAAARAQLDPNSSERMAEIEMRIREVQEESERAHNEELQRHEAELVELESKMADLQAEATSLREEERERHRQVVRRLENELTELRAQAEKSGKLRSMDTKIIATLRDKIAMLDGELKRTEQQLAEERDRVLTAKRAVLDEASFMVSPLSPSIRENELSALVEELGQKAEALKNARQATVEQAEDEENAQAEQIAELEVRIINLIKELEQTRNADRAQHTRQVSGMLTKIAQLENEVLEARERYEVAAANDAEEIAHLREQVELKTQRIQELEELLDEHDEEMAMINASKQEHESKVLALEQQVAALKLASNRVASELEQLHNDDGSDNPSESNAEHRIRLLTAEATDLRRVNERMAAQLQRLENISLMTTDTSQVMSLQQEIQQLEATNYRLLEQLEKVAGDEGESAGQFLSLEEEIQRLESTNGRMLDQVKMLETRMRELDAQKKAEALRASQVEAELQHIHMKYQGAHAPQADTDAKQDESHATRELANEANDAISADLIKLQEQLTLLAQAKDDCARELEEVRAQLTASQEESVKQIESLREELETLQTTHATELERLKAERDELEAARAAADARATKLDTELQSQDDTTLESLRNVVRELEATSDASLQRLTELQKQLLALESENSEYKELVAELEAALSRAQDGTDTNLVQLEEQLRDAQQRHRDEIHATQSQLEEARTANEALQKQLVELETTASAAQEDKKATEEILVALEATHNEQADRISSLEQELKMAQEALAKSSASEAQSVSGPTAEMFALLQKELSTLEETLELKQSVDNGDDQQDANVVAVRSLLARVRQVEEARAVLDKRSQGYEADVRDLESLVEELSDNNKQLTEQLSSKQSGDSSDSLTERIAQLENERAELNKEKEKYTLEVRQLEEEMEQVGAINLELENEVTRLVDALRKMEQAKKQDNGVEGSDNSDAGQLRDKLASQETNIIQQTKLIKTQEERIVELELTIEAMHRQQLSSPSRRPSRLSDESNGGYKHKLANGSLSNIDVSPPPTPPPRIPPPPTPIPTSSPPSPTSSRSPSPPGHNNNNSSNNGNPAEEARLRNQVKQLEGDLRGHVALIETLEKSLGDMEIAQRDLERSKESASQQVERERIEKQKMTEALETLQRKMDEMRGMFEGERVKSAQLLEKNRALERQMLELKAKKSKLLCF